MTNHPAQCDSEVFIQDIERLLIPMGMSPIAARINGYLLLSADPKSLDEIVENLRISKSSASVAARMLERYGIVRRVTEAGTKRVRYSISGRCDGFLAEQIRLFDAMGQLLKERSRARPGAPTSGRLRELGDFYLRLRDAMTAVYGGERGSPRDALD